MAGQFDRIKEALAKGPSNRRIVARPGGKSEILPEKDKGVPGIVVNPEAPNGSILLRESGRNGTDTIESNDTFPAPETVNNVFGLERIAAEYDKTASANRRNADAARAEEAAAAAEQEHTENLKTTSMRMGKFGRHVVDTDATLRTARDRGYTPVDTSTQETIESSTGIKPDTFRKNRNEQRRKEIADAFEAPDLATTTMRRDANGNPYDTEDENHGPSVKEGMDDSAPVKIPVYDEEGNVNYPYSDPNSPLSTTMREAINVAQVDRPGTRKGLPSKFANGKEASPDRAAYDAERPLTAFKNNKGEVISTKDMVPKTEGERGQGLDEREDDASRAASGIPTVDKSDNAETTEPKKNQLEEGTHVEESEEEREKRENAELYPSKEVEEAMSGSDRQDLMDRREAKLRAATAKDVAAERAAKGQRAPKPVKAPAEPRFGETPWDQQDLWDEEGNVKPEHDINSDYFDEKGRPVKPGANPMSTTTMRERVTPAPVFRSPAHEAAFNARTASMNRLREKHAKYLNGEFDDKGQQHLKAAEAAYTADLKQHNRAYVEPEGGYFSNEPDTVTYEEAPGVRGSNITPALDKPERPSNRNNLIHIDTSLYQDENRSDEDLEKERRRNARNRSRNTKTSELKLNETSAGAPATLSDERNYVDTQKLLNRSQQGVPNTLMAPEVHERAKRLATRLGMTPQQVNGPTFTREHVASMAYVMHHAGIEEDTSGANKDLKKLAAHTGSGGQQVKVNGQKTGINEDRLLATRNLMDKAERWKEGKQTTYVEGTDKSKGHIIRDEDYFKAPKSGEIVPFSNTNHPEHPGFNLTGSEQEFTGFTAHPDAGGVPLVRGSMEGGDFYHEGWHPYKYRSKDGTERRVFEKHSIPQNAIHAGDIMKELASKGITTTAAIDRMSKNKPVGIELSGMAVNSYEDPEHYAKHDSESSPVANCPQCAHENHIRVGMSSGNCAKCGEVTAALAGTRKANNEAAWKDMAIKMDQAGRPALAPRTLKGLHSFTNASGETEQLKPEAVAKIKPFTRTEGQFVEQNNAADLRKLYGNGTPTTDKE